MGEQWRTGYLHMKLLRWARARAELSTSPGVQIPFKGAPGLGLMIVYPSLEELRAEHGEEAPYTEVMYSAAGPGQEPAEPAEPCGPPPAVAPTRKRPLYILTGEPDVAAQWARMNGLYELDFVLVRYASQLRGLEGIDIIRVAFDTMPLAEKLDMLRALERVRQVRDLGSANKHQVKDLR